MATPQRGNTVEILLSSEKNFLTPKNIFYERGVIPTYQASTLLN